MKNSLDDQGLAISSMVAMPGAASVACGTTALGSGAGEGTSICGCGSPALVSEWLGRSAKCAPKNYDDEQGDESDDEFGGRAAGVGGASVGGGVRRDAGDLRYLRLEAVRWGLLGHICSQ